MLCIVTSGRLAELMVESPIRSRSESDFLPLTSLAARGDHFILL